MEQPALIILATGAVLFFVALAINPFAIQFMWYWWPTYVIIAATATAVAAALWQTKRDRDQRTPPS